GLRLDGESKVQLIKDHYEILTAKRRENYYRGNRKVFHLETADGKKMDIIFQVSNDGVAFRYYFPETNSTVHQLTAEASSYHFLPGTHAWLQPMQKARSGWKQATPAYEELYDKDISVGTRSDYGAGWVYPGLFRSGDTWLLVSESSLPRNYCGTHLGDPSADGEYTVAFPDPAEKMGEKIVDPQSTLPWLTPWRFVAVGSLKTIVESTLGTDLADPAKFHSSVKPGKASWSWPLMGDANTTYDVQKRFIDYASRMHWRYCLIDALWDQQIGYDKVAELVKYAKTKDVKILVWYNSAGDWNTVPFTPRDKLLTHASRIAEFDKLKKMGVAGLKIDFFGGDGQSMIDYYQDILEDARPYGFAMNFHGATLPRGWERTYPNLMTMEAIRGLEYMTFEQKNADQEPTHAPMLPFTRNIFDPMDFTPMALYRINDHVQRRTTSAFELALSVLFVSGIQHYAETPEGMAKAPDYVQDYLKHVPSIWDDTKFLDGFPGKYVVLARKGDGKWFIAGINGEETPKPLVLDLEELHGGRSGTLITDGGSDSLSFRREKIHLDSSRKLDVTLQPHGGFVLVLD
ncbi:MAG TPA: glycoside hydrolase family 97 catalytic domain-containing protein, partial [Verrucomicrobiae bacterium]|nr:glycoside hydrolase family 97 catalytic domain-containing protein [Verrucomicrobiae bacterium]